MENGTFCGFQIQRHMTIDNAWCVTGCGTGAYQEFYKDIGRNIQNIETYRNGNSKRVNVDPCLIEGIILDQHAIENPASFWSQHKKDGTMDTFLEIARYIPEVERELKQGHSLLALLKDPCLGPCAAIYFDTRRPDALDLIDCGGFYWFQSNGRHRVLAARALGYAIPARIRGHLKT